MCAVQMPTVKVEALWLRLFVCRIINDLPLILHKCQGQADRKQTGRTLTFGIGQAGSRSRSLLSASRQTEVNNQYHLITLITLFCAALLFFHSHFFFCGFVLGTYFIALRFRYPNAFVTGGMAECLDDSTINVLLPHFAFAFQSATVRRKRMKRVYQLQHAKCYNLLAFGQYL